MCIIRFKIWHYTGSLVYQRPWNNQEELWEVTWQNFPLSTFQQKPISYKAVEGIVSSPSQSQGNDYFYEYFRNEYLSKHKNLT